ncbi:protein EFR3 homolog stmA isoform X2 [Rhipicephalus microplus]|uniref:protein EFR3 homolog stmA isoform X2 n=1 Tax=Rhipicephalus microplus TaxID=6941 RepID=UPI003F6B5DE4
MSFLTPSLRWCMESQWVGSILKQCEQHDCCCGCCAALRPRYKRLVDNIFPANPEDGLVRNNMEKLTFYALSSPEKLDRIGEYLALRVSRDISRHRLKYVEISMEAMDQLLVACHAQSLNLFVESFLKMVQRLLECQNPDLQLLATQSFVRFANIEEDTPSYHRRYDFFVSKFSSLCHDNNPDVELRKQLRLAGLRGLQGVVRKTVSDDLQVNIWDETHMEKIVPSLLFNMQDANARASETPDSPQVETPVTLAENCFREVMGRATYGHIASVIKPVLKHLDNHQLWVPNTFSVYTFKIIMYSIQAQYSYAVIQILMNHLDEMYRVETGASTVDETDQDQGTPVSKGPKVRTGIVKVLFHIVTIAAGESVGPSVLEVFHSLLNHLRHSITIRSSDGSDVEDEREFQEAVIATLGEFANNLPDYQKIEIMMFILGKVPAPQGPDEGFDAHDGGVAPNLKDNSEVLLQHIMLKSLLTVGQKYRTVQLSQAFPTAFLQSLLRMSLARDPSVRLLVQNILHTLLDRHKNLKHLSVMPNCQDPVGELHVEKCSRQDTVFMKKNGPDLLSHIYENAQLSNNLPTNYQALYTTLALLCVELGSEDVLIELLRLMFAIQDLPGSGLVSMSGSHMASLHALVAAFMFLAGQLTSIPSLCTHVTEVIKVRRERTPQLLPQGPPLTMPLGQVPEQALFDRNIVAEALRSTGHDPSKLFTPYAPRHSSVQGGEANVTRSVSDLNSNNIEVASVNSSPGFIRKHPEEEITVEALKKMMQEPVNSQKVAEEQRYKVLERFRSTPFLELLSSAQQHHQTIDLHGKLKEILGKLPGSNAGPSSAGRHATMATGQHSLNLAQESHAAPVYEINFPELFVF